MNRITFVIIAVILFSNCQSTYESGSNLETLLKVIQIPGSHYEKVEERNKDGKIVKEYYTIYGAKDSLFIEYNTSGKVKTRSFYQDNQLYKDQFEYFANGTLKKYSYFAPAGVCQFIRLNDSITGKRVSDSGKFNPVLLFNKKQGVLNINDKLSLQIHFIKPPGFKCNAKLGVGYENELIWKQLNPAFTPIEIETDFYKRGKFYVKLFSETDDTITNLILSTEEVKEWKIN